jgi:dolichyl-diphosphooligosaccharide--protein glycosyltransferase
MTPVKQWQLATERETYAAATQMQTYAAERGLEHPESYVFSSWGSNRTYNYFVNGESRSYAFAREQYPAFAASTDEESWARELGGDAGFVVTDDDDLSDASDLPEDTLYRQLHEGYGIDTGHFRAIWASGDESKKAFALVPGATVTGPGEPGATVTLRREGSVGETTFTFERSVPVNDHGVFTTRLPQPGDFSLGEGRVTIPESAVEAGEAVSLFSGPGAGYWSFDEGEGSTAHDRVGGRHATLAGDADWTEGISGSAIQLGRSGYVQLPLSTAPQFSLSFWIRPAAVDATDENDFRHVVHGRRGDLLVLEEWESITLRIPGVTDDGWSAGSIPTGEWTHVVATYDGSRRAIFVDGELAGRDSTEGGPAEWGEWLRVGARTADGTAHGFEGVIDELRVFETALGEDRVEGLFRSGRE